MSTAFSVQNYLAVTLDETCEECDWPELCNLINRRTCEVISTYCRNCGTIWAATPHDMTVTSQWISSTGGTHMDSEAEEDEA